MNAKQCAKTWTQEQGQFNKLKQQTNRLNRLEWSKKTYEPIGMKNKATQHILELNGMEKQNSKMNDRKNLCGWSHGREEHANWKVIDPR